MSEFYARQIQLFGEDIQKDLSSKSIAIIGCGGLGCSLAYALATSGVGSIWLVDFDEVSLSNLHRQIGFTYEDIGELKSKALARSLQKRVEKKTSLNAYEGRFESFVEQNIQLDLILDGTDNMETRAKIDDFCKKVNIPWAYSSVEEWYGQICFFDSIKFDKIFKQKVLPSKGQVAPMVMQIASFSSILALRYLCGFEVKKDYLYNLDFSCFEPKKQGFYLS